jgi:hypothetical protein
MPRRNLIPSLFDSTLPPRIVPGAEPVALAMPPMTPVNPVLDPIGISPGATVTPCPCQCPIDASPGNPMQTTIPGISPAPLLPAPVGSSPVGSFPEPIMVVPLS